MLLAVIDAMIHTSLKAEASRDVLRRLRVLSATTLTFFLQTLVMMVIGAVFLHTERGVEGVCAVLLAIFGFILWRLRYAGQSAGSALLLSVSGLAIMAGISLFDDRFYSVVSPAIALLVLLAMYLGGMRAAGITGGLSVLAIICSTTAHYLGFTLGPLSGGGNPVLTDGVVGAVNLTFMLGLVALVDDTGRTMLIALEAALEKSVTDQRELEETHAELELGASMLREEMNLRTGVELELRQAQKLEAVGRLAAGIAHEINTPVQFVGDSLRFLREAAETQLALLATYRRIIDAGGARDEMLKAVDAANSEADLEYLAENVPPAFERSGEGLARVAKIVRGMKEFSHPDADPVAADLNAAVQATLAIAVNEYKGVADVETRFGPVPLVRCRIGQINQAVLNIVINAAHAIEDRYRGTGQKGHIRVATSVEDRFAVVSIQDDGMGIPPEVQPRIFDPFFTTKDVGRGTGQGLAIARSVVVKQHGGTLTFETAAGVGTTFFLRLPLEPAVPSLVSSPLSIPPTPSAQRTGPPS